MQTRERAHCARSVFPFIKKKKIAVFKNIFLACFNTCLKNNIADLIIVNCRFASKLIINDLFSYVKLKLTNITIYKESNEMIH